MRPVLLISANFAREQRWPLVFLLLWVLGFTLFGFFVDSRNGAPDVLMVFKQLAVYGVAFAIFFGSSAIQSDLRSRRILAVLSKAVSRGQYLGGLLAGIGVVLGASCLCTGFSAAWVLERFGLDLSGLWWEILALFTACMLAASLTLCLSTFLPPLFAAIGSGMLAGLPALLTLQGGELAKYVIPIYGLLEPLLQADSNIVWPSNHAIVFLGWVETAILALVASWIFSRRDLAVAVE